jgi:hypothetical protein
MITRPLLFFSKKINLQLEKHNLTGASRYQSFVIDQVHLTQDFINNFLVNKRNNLSFIKVTIDCMDRNSITLTLSIKSIDLIFVTVVKRSPWEILVVTIDLKFLESRNIFCQHVVKEMIMCTLLI